MAARITFGVLAIATIVAGGAACGSAEPKSAATAAEFKQALAGAPERSRGCTRARRVLDGGPAAYKRQIAELRDTRWS